MTSMTERQLDTRRRVDQLMEKHGGRALWSRLISEHYGYFVGYMVRGRGVIVLFYARGGCTHFVQSETTTWEAFDAEMKAMAENTEPAPDRIGG